MCLSLGTRTFTRAFKSRLDMPERGHSGRRVRTIAWQDLCVIVVGESPVFYVAKIYCAGKMSYQNYFLGVMNSEQTIQTLGTLAANVANASQLFATAQRLHQLLVGMRSVDADVAASPGLLAC